MTNRDAVCELVTFLDRQPETDEAVRAVAAVDTLVQNIWGISLSTFIEGAVDEMVLRR